MNMTTAAAAATKPEAEKIYAFSTLEKYLINTLQKGLPICESPFAMIAEQINYQTANNTLHGMPVCNEKLIIETLNNLLELGILTRFGPMFDAACLGGAFTLAAIDVPQSRFEEVTNIVNSFPQVAHNYERSHQLNMWFVVGTESQSEIDDVINAIELKTGLTVLNVPKLEEFYVGLYFEV